MTRTRELLQNFTYLPLDGPGEFTHAHTCYLLWRRAKGDERRRKTLDVLKAFGVPNGLVDSPSEAENLIEALMTDYNYRHLAQTKRLAAGQQARYQARNKDELVTIERIHATGRLTIVRPNGRRVNISPLPIDTVV